MCAVHSSGSGSSWLEDLDVDQPHGEDYLEFNDLRIGIRLRAGQEHTDPADSTAGFIHKPGGCAILAMDITNAVGDPTGNVVADGTFRGHGLAWTYEVQAGANKGMLWCATAAAGLSTTGDWTLVKLHPDLQWAGGDITWQGAHEFDASVDISGNVAIDGDLTVDGSTSLGADVFVGGDLSIDGDFMLDGSWLPTSCATDFGGFLDEDDLGSDATAATASQQSIKAYADLDSSGSVMHDAEGGFTNADLNGTKTKIYTKYFTGTMDADSETSVAHGITSGETKILSVSVGVKASDASVRFIEMFNGSAAPTLSGQWDDTNVVLSNIAAVFQSQPHYIKIDYIL